MINNFSEQVNLDKKNENSLHWQYRGNGRILIVHDINGYPVFQNMHTYDVEHARSVKEAIDFLENKLFDEVWLDFNITKKENCIPVIHWLNNNPRKKIKIIRIITEHIHNFSKMITLLDPENVTIITSKNDEWVHKKKTEQKYSQKYRQNITKEFFKV